MKRIALLLLLAACDTAVRGPEGLTSFQVELTDSLGSPSARRPLSRAAETLHVRARAFGADGKLLAYTSEVDPNSGCCTKHCASVRVTPGRLVAPTLRFVFQDGVAVYATQTILGVQGPTCIKRAAGADGTIGVDVERVYSDTKLWVESEEGLASGVGGPVWYADPSVVDIQWFDGMLDNTESPLSGGYIRTGEGDMIVTAIFAEGFYVTDLAAHNGPPIADPNLTGRDLPGRFAGLYMFNFSYPDNLLLGDRLKQISGTATDFSGATQLTFPAWVRDTGGPYPAALPVPKRIGTEDCNATLSSPTDSKAPDCGYDKTNWNLESLESSIVCAEVKTPDEFEDCDFNGNGEIQNPNPSGTGWTCIPFNVSVPPDPECLCLLDCIHGQGKHAGKVCTELSNYRRFGQWIGALDRGAGPRVLVLSRDGAPDFDPFVLGNRGRIVDLAGPLRQIRAARPRWLVQVRDEEDLCIDPPCAEFRCE